MCSNRLIESNELYNCVSTIHNIIINLLINDEIFDITLHLLTVLWHSLHFYRCPFSVSSDHT